MTVVNIVAKATRLPRVVRMLAQHGGDALKHKVENGNRRIAAAARKRSLIYGTFGSFDPLKGGGWDPAWDEPKKVFLIKPNKGHARERSRPERALKITKALQGMPARFDAYEKEVNERKPKKDILFMFKRVTEIYRKKIGKTGPTSLPSGGVVKQSKKPNKKK